MRTHPLPQNVTTFQDKIIGELTAKQFVVIAVGAVVAFAVYVTPLPGFIKVVFIGGSVAFSLAVAFAKVNSRSLDQWTLNFFTAIYSPTQRIWQKNDPVPPLLIEKKAETSSQKTTAAPTRKDHLLAEFLDFTTSLDSGKDLFDKEDRAHIAALDFTAPLAPKFTPTRMRETMISAPFYPAEAIIPAVSAMNAPIPAATLQTPKTAGFSGVPLPLPPTPPLPISTKRAEGLPTNLPEKTPILQSAGKNEVPKSPEMVVGALPSDVPKPRRRTDLELPPVRINPLQALPDRAVLPLAYDSQYAQKPSVRVVIPGGQMRTFGPSLQARSGRGLRRRSDLESFNPLSVQGEIKFEPSDDFLTTLTTHEVSQSLKKLIETRVPHEALEKPVSQPAASQKVVSVPAASEEQAPQEIIDIALKPLNITTATPAFEPKQKMARKLQDVTSLSKPPMPIPPVAPSASSASVASSAPPVLTPPLIPKTPMIPAPPLPPIGENLTWAKAPKESIADARPTIISDSEASGNSTPAGKVQYQKSADRNVEPLQSSFKEALSEAEAEVAKLMGEIQTMTEKSPTLTSDVVALAEYSNRLLNLKAEKSAAETRVEQLKQQLQSWGEQAHILTTTAPIETKPGVASYGIATVAPFTPASTQITPLTANPNAISGIVKDDLGKFLQGVIILVKDDQGNPMRALKTNLLGQFIVVTPLKNGVYRVEFQKDGFNFDIIQIELSGGIPPPLEIQARKAGSHD